MACLFVTRASLTAALLLGMLVGPAATGLAEDASSERSAATQRAYATLTSGNAAQLGPVLAELDRTASAQNDGYSYFYAGALRIWSIVETSSIDGLLTLPSLIQKALTSLERGHQMLPDDFRATAFLALGQLIIGNSFGDEALRSKGLSTFETAFAQMPAYAHYLRGVSQSGTPRDSASFRMAMDDLRAVTEKCGYPRGEAPYSFRYPSAPREAPAPGVCLDEGMVPHVWEGVFATYGDIMVKAGDLAAGRALYESAKTAPHFAAWPYRLALEERLRTIDARAAQHADRNPLNDPALWTAGKMVCVGCHQEGGEPVR